jgi:DNA-binding CsgD family transcriptional regulator
MDPRMLRSICSIWRIHNCRQAEYAVFWHSRANLFTGPNGMDLSKLAAGFAANLERQHDIDGHLDALAEAADQLGFPMVDYSFMPVARLSNGSWFPPRLIWRNFPSRWEVDWPRHCANDPYYHACYRSHSYVNWADIQKRADLSALERDSWNYIADKAMTRGITVPIHLPGRRFAFVSGVEYRSDMRSDDLSKAADALFLIAHYFHAAVYSKFKDPLTSTYRNSGGGDLGTALTDRELQCLTLAARGKTATETAEVLDRSVETVRDHLRSGASKLGALNCAHAVAKATFFGLIPLENDLAMLSQKLTAACVRSSMLP